MVLHDLCKFEESGRLLGDTMTLLQQVAGKDHPSTHETAAMLQDLLRSVRLLSPGNRVQVWGYRRTPRSTGS